MSSKFFHQRKDFKSLISTLSAETGILDALIEKDYWIMHVLYGMKNLGLGFELRGGTSLSKGFKIIDRFSEDIFKPMQTAPNRISTTKDQKVGWKK